MGAVSIAHHSSYGAAKHVCRAHLPSVPNARALSRVIFVTSGPKGTLTVTRRCFAQSTGATLHSARTISTLRVCDVVRMESRRGIKEASDPVIRTASPAPLAQDFARQQVSKQQRSNFHSTSLSPLLLHTMVSTVNKTNLHPSGLQYVN
jgi:phosphoenolpyruvate carboxykinase (ATP)